MMTAPSLWKVAWSGGRKSLEVGSLWESGRAYKALVKSMTRQLPVFMALFLVPMLRLSTAHAWKQKLQCLLQLPCQENPGSMTVTAGDKLLSVFCPQPW